MLETYEEMMDRQQKEFNAIGTKYAFSDSQFEQICTEFGITVDEAPEKLTSIGFGGFILKDNKHLIKEFFERTHKELHDAIDKDVTGMDFCKDMFKYELWNHEYAYSHDEEEVVEACGLDSDEVIASDKLKNAFVLARREYWKEFEEAGN